jgi:prepilin-type N-terminal cleavage/methylation domain-containing protein
VKRVKRNAFSLIEVVAAVTIIAIMFSGLASLRVSQTQYAKDAEIERDIVTIQDALSCYLYFHGEEAGGLADITIDRLFQKGFLIGENKSPWGTSYKLTIKDSSVLVETKTSEEN